jgi:hypothetical protein
MGPTRMKFPEKDQSRTISHEGTSGQQGVDENEVQQSSYKVFSFRATISWSRGDTSSRLFLHCTCIGGLFGVNQIPGSDTVGWTVAY